MTVPLYSEDSYIMISALQHFMFCPRQCALMFVECLWKDNYFTVAGDIFHEKAHSGTEETRKNLHTARALKIASVRLGLSGVTDVVEFRREPEKNANTAELPELAGFWRPYPIEYKRGRAKEEPWDEVQLCAQAICLEEMLGVEIVNGALFYGAEHRRHAVAFTPELRQLTESIAGKVHDLIESGVTPPPVYAARCKACSLVELCMPKKTAGTTGDYASALYGDSR